MFTTVPRRSLLYLEYAFFLESFADRDYFWVVDEQQRDRHSANLGQRLQFRPIPDKMFRPSIAPGMKQANDVTAIVINASKVRALEPVALDASEREVIGGGSAAVLSRNNVIDLERRPGEMSRANGNTRSVLLIVAKPGG